MRTKITQICHYWQNKMSNWYVKFKFWKLMLQHDIKAFTNHKKPYLSFVIYQTLRHVHLEHHQKFDKK